VVERLPVAYPKIELHVHLEGTVRAETLLAIARRNDVSLPAGSVGELRELYRYRDFAHFLEVWYLTTQALRTAEDFRQIVVDYAAEAAGCGAVYIEGSFSPAESARRGVRWEEIFSGYCDGAQEARERFGVEIRLTPEIVSGFSDEEAALTVRHAIAYRERGVVGVGLVPHKGEYSFEPYSDVFRQARDGGLGSAPHAGEVGAVTSVRSALDDLRADRIRHGIRSVDDASLVRELVDRGTVLDVCLVSNLRTGAIRSLTEHPLLRLTAEGVQCSLSTDDPAMFDTDLDREYSIAATLGLQPRGFFDAGVAGALCDEETRSRIQAIGESFDWAALQT
jgi:aminodeoxyfutalosine deaminase